MVKRVHERRRGPDFWINLAKGAAILAWSSFLVALIAFHFARPERDWGVVRYWGLEIRTFWASPWSEGLMVALWVCAGLSAVSLVANRLRSRRKQDHLRFNVILLLITSSCCIVLLFSAWR